MKPNLCLINLFSRTILLLLLAAAFCLSSCAATSSDANLRQMNDSSVSHSPSNVDPTRPPSIPDLLNSKTPPPTPEQAKAQLNELGRNWLYGPGIGRTVANVGTVVVFPPYVFYLLGNAGLALAGFEPLYITDILPDAPKEQVLAVYDSVTSVPGRTAAAIAGEEYQEMKEEEVQPNAEVTTDATVQSNPLPVASQNLNEKNNEQE